MHFGALRAFLGEHWKVAGSVKPPKLEPKHQDGHARVGPEGAIPQILMFLHLLEKHANNEGQEHRVLMKC